MTIESYLGTVSNYWHTGRPGGVHPQKIVDGVVHMVIHIVIRPGKSQSVSNGDLNRKLRRSPSRAIVQEVGVVIAQAALEFFTRHYREKEENSLEAKRM